MVIVFFRHGEKKWTNGYKSKNLDEYPHDPPLKPVQELLTENLQQLVHSGFIPTKIHSSPYLRCKQTASVIQEEYRKKGIEVSVIYEPILREYLGHHTMAKIPQELVKFLNEVKIIETFEEFNQRIEEIKQQGWYKDNILVVTHGLVIKTLTKLDHNVRQGECIVASVN